jgi:hypothetical protein
LTKKLLAELHGKTALAGGARASAVKLAKMRTLVQSDSCAEM